MKQGIHSHVRAGRRNGKKESKPQYPHAVATSFSPIVYVAGKQKEDGDGGIEGLLQRSKRNMKQSGGSQVVT